MAPKLDCLEQAYAYRYPRRIALTRPVIILSAVSGVGRSTAACGLAERLKAGLIRNFTTRPRRSPEEDSTYLFGTATDLEFALAHDRVLSYLHWRPNDSYYALLIDEIQAKQRQHAVLVYDTTRFGVALKSQNPALVFHVWLVCESAPVLRRRLSTRKTEPFDEIERRLADSVAEQRFVLEHGRELIQAGLVDALVSTERRSPEETLEAILALARRFPALMSAGAAPSAKAALACDPLGAMA
jgi:guanylate kinase